MGLLNKLRSLDGDEFDQPYECTLAG